MNNQNITRIKAVIVEDEEPSLVTIKALLKDFSEIEIVGEAKTGRSAIKLINACKPDLMFLDIQLPGGDGFEVLRQVEHNPMVIFTTAYREHALEAFETNGIDYILKPITRDRLKKAIEKVKNLNKRFDPAMLDTLKKLIDPHTRKTRFFIKEDDQILIIPQEEVIYFHSEDKYVFLNTYDKSYFYNASLKTLANTLDPDTFIRINKSYIISIDKMEKLKKFFNRSYNIILKDKKKTSLPVGRNFLPPLKQKLGL